MAGQDQQNDARIFVILFSEKTRFLRENCPFKKGAALKCSSQIRETPVRIWAEGLKSAFASMEPSKEFWAKKARKRLMRLAFTRRIYTVLLLWRCHPDLNWGVKVLQTFALPLGHGTIYVGRSRKTPANLLWSGLRGSNSLPPPWQGGALPDELSPRWCLRSESNQ